VEVSVTDRGCGFDPSAVPSGTGLRASITARMTEAGGTAHIESAPGEGTIVRLTAPRGLVPAADAADPASQPVPTRPEQAAMQGNG
jgi:signal transduction histidine kinase